MCIFFGGGGRGGEVPCSTCSRAGCFCTLRASLELSYVFARRVVCFVRSCIRPGHPTLARLTLTQEQRTAGRVGPILEGYKSLSSNLPQT